MTEDNLIEGCLRKDSKCQKALYEQFKVPMYRICLRYAADSYEAQDMLQDGFIKVYSDLHQFRREGPLGAWIRRVMVNTALTHLRKKKKLFSDVDISNLSNVVHTNENIHAELDAQKLTMLVQQLPPGYRVVFNMYVIEGYPHKEIAEKLNISVNTSKSQLSKAKATLRKVIEKVLVD